MIQPRVFAEVQIAMNQLVRILLSSHLLSQFHVQSYSVHPAKTKKNENQFLTKIIQKKEFTSELKRSSFSLENIHAKGKKVCNMTI